VRELLREVDVDGRMKAPEDSFPFISFSRPTYFVSSYCTRRSAFLFFCFVVFFSIEGREQGAELLE
jgi:hypothetical protein